MTVNNIADSFVHNIRISLLSLGVDFNKVRSSGESIGLGISGGADSVSLFSALCEILKKEEIPLVCVHVNHHIREKAETDGDMNFVKDLCSDAVDKGLNVKLEVFDLEEGKIAEIQDERKGGTEEAARYMRYQCFEEAAEKHKISYFCLAHNLDDNLETILMRFLKGSRAGGIKDVRDMFIRPLMKTSRKEIEDYLCEIKQSYRTDSTNFSDEYFRNSIRHNLVPVLNENFPDWKKALLSGEDKRRIDNAFIDDLAEKEGLSKDLFDEKRKALCFRVLVREMNRAGVNERVTSEFLEDFFNETRNAVACKKTFSKRYASLEMGFDGKKVFLKTYEKRQTDSGFFDIIERSGEYTFPFGKMTVLELENNTAKVLFEGNTVTKGISFPFVIRSPQLGEKNRLYVIEG